MYKLNYLDSNNEHKHANDKNLNKLKRILENAFYHHDISWREDSGTSRAYIGNSLVGWIHS